METTEKAVEETVNPVADATGKEVKKTKTLFRHNDESWTGRRFTVAAVPVGEKKVNVGVAICSLHDSFCKKTGRELAEKRAMELPFAEMSFPMAKDSYDACLIALNTSNAFVEANVQYVMDKLNAIKKA